MAATASADFEIGPVPSDAPAGLDVFTKHVDVLGLHVFAKSNVSDSRVLHCANILAQWLDNDEDGVPDNSAVHQNLVDNYASMLMWWNENQAEGDMDSIPDSTWDNYYLQDTSFDDPAMSVSGAVATAADSLTELDGPSTEGPNVKGSAAAAAAPLALLATGMQPQPEQAGMCGFQ